MKSLENDTLIESKDCTPKREGNFLLSSVKPCDSGEGLPYAPVDWPNPGDNWSWRVGSRMNRSGYYTDRFLYLPTRLRHPSRPNQNFGSKTAVERYIRSEFPDADIDAFFATFSWKIPSTEQTWTEGQTSTPVSNGDQQKMKSVVNDTLIKTKDCTPVRESNFLLSPVSPYDSGEGLPYAPIDWPNPGDNWSWRVGSRMNKSGYYSERFLYLPTRLQNLSGRSQNFASKPAIERYIQSEFPDADIDAFFGSFSWKIPSTKQTWTEDHSSTPVSNLTWTEGQNSTSVSNVFQQKMKSEESDTLIESNGCTPMRKSDFLLIPVSPGESGEGLPYAPIDWPNPGDNWKWRVGSRISKTGYYTDRFLYLPRHLQNLSGSTQFFPSKTAVERYIRSEFPDADIDAFFASFSWKIPSTTQSWTKVEAFCAPPQEANKAEEIKGKEEHIPRTSSRKRKQRAGRILAQTTQKTRRHSKNIDSFNSEYDDATDEFSLNNDTETGDACQSPIAFKVLDVETSQESPSKLEDFDKYFNSLQDILARPLSIPLTYSSASSKFHAIGAEAFNSQKRLSSLLAMDFPSLVSSENLSELKNLVSELQKDPNLGADQVVKLKLIEEEIPVVSEIFVRSKEVVEQAEKFFTDVEANKAKITKLKEEYNGLKDEIDQLQTEVDASSGTIKEIDDQIAQLQFRQAELTGITEIKKAAKEELIAAHKRLAGSIQAVVNDVRLADSKKQDWELKKEKAVKSEKDILARYATLKEFSL